MEQKRLKTAIIGIGRWGKNVARELADQSELVAFVSHGSAENEAWATSSIPSAQKLTLEEVCVSKDIQVVAGATPIATHAEIVRALLAGGKHVLCEKPLAETAVTAFELATLAKEHSLILATGYVYLYHPTYQELKKNVVGQKISRVEFVWKKHGTFKETIELNLLTHHLALALDLMGKPESGKILRCEAHETACDIIETKLTYPSCEVISLIDRVSQEKTHTMTVHADGKVYVWEGTQLRDSRGLFSERDMPLAREVSAFLESVGGGPVPQTAGDFGAHVLELHEMLR